jgi:hypothetical protein
MLTTEAGPGVGGDDALKGEGIVFEECPFDTCVAYVENEIHLLKRFIALSGPWVAKQVMASQALSI